MDQSPDHRMKSPIETIQSLLVAFVLAMTFRAFVAEGFVIPTGSMAPSLLGTHVRVHCGQTGWTYAMGFDTSWGNRGLLMRRYEQASDPMIGPGFPGTGADKDGFPRSRMGDRILVHKSLYPFCSPRRFDVVVFKNPTNPNGADGNYIKRLIGLPGESIWLVDGDVFVSTAEDSGDLSTYSIRRKPEMVQRAIWQPVYDSDYYPVKPESLDVFFPGSPWNGADDWQVEGRREFRCESSEPAVLEWGNRPRKIDDWMPYNTISGQRMEPMNTADLRVAATVEADQDGLDLVFEIRAHGHVFQYMLGEEMAEVRMRYGAFEEQDIVPDANWQGVRAPLSTRPFNAGRPTRVEFWHFDQQMAIYLDGTRVVAHAYEWTPAERLGFATNEFPDPPQNIEAISRYRRSSGPPTLSWDFSGSPLTLTRLLVDRDLYYRVDRISRSNARKNPGFSDHAELVADGQYAFGTHPDNLAHLGPDHYFMLGDNSTASSDSRLWGNPHPSVSVQIDAHPFVVHRSLLLGKAWVVYFPAPLTAPFGSRAFIPDFGSLRFIR